MLTIITILTGLLFLSIPDRSEPEGNEAALRGNNAETSAADTTPRDKGKAQAAKAKALDSNEKGTSGNVLIGERPESNTRTAGQDGTASSEAGGHSLATAAEPEFRALDIRYMNPDANGNGKVPPTTLLIDEALLMMPSLSAPPSGDSSSFKEKPKLDYSGFYISASYSTRSFDALNSRLAAAGFPSISRNGAFSSALTFEFPRPIGDGSPQPSFPAYLFPASIRYSPAFSVEWMSKPEISSADGSAKAALSSWTLILDNNFFIKEFQQSRILLVLSYCFNWTSLTVARHGSFDEQLNLADGGNVVSMTRSYPFTLRTALRYDYVLGGYYLGLTAGYNFMLAKGGWSMRSGFDFNPGISTDGGPDDTINGWYFGFHFTMR